MISRNWEDWTFGLSLAAAAAVSLTLHEVRAPSFAPDAVAAERADYTMTVTAKRLPAECKGLTSRTVSAQCAAAFDNSTVSVTTR